MFSSVVDGHCIMRVGESHAAWKMVDRMGWLSTSITDISAEESGESEGFKDTGENSTEFQITQLVKLN